MIKKRRLGKTEIYVSEIGLGGWQLGEPTMINNQPGIAFGGMDEKTALGIIRKAVELGINTFDTADVYSLGNSEYRLGKALKEYRADVNIFTKGGNMVGNPASYDISYHHLMASIDRSLNRLQTDYVDLFQVHVPPKTEKEFADVEKVFDDIKSEGKARNCGISIGIRYEQGKEIIKRKLADSIQIYFSLIDQKPLKELLPLAKKNNIGVIVAEPIAQGLLTNKYKIGHTFPKNDLRSNGYSKQLLEKKLKRVKQFNFLIKKNRTLNQAALAYVLSREEVSTCIPGAKSTEQLISNVTSSKIKLNQPELKKIEEIQVEWGD
jgi:aryl-alcohol dehydrogenase-like predicted oxidoreductase